MLGVIFIYSSSLFNEARALKEAQSCFWGFCFCFLRLELGKRARGGGGTQHLSNSEESNSGPHTCEASALTTEIPRDR